MFSYLMPRVTHSYVAWFTAVPILVGSFRMFLNEVVTDAD